MATEKQIDSVRTSAQKFSRRRRKMYIDYNLFNSPAYANLKNFTAARIYGLFLRKRVMKRIEGKPRRAKTDEYYIANNGEIQFTYNEAYKKYGIASSNFRTGIDRLVENGFIDITYTGMGVVKNVSLYSISERWRLYGTDRFVKAKKRPVRKWRRGKKDNVGKTKAQRQTVNEVM